MKKMTIKQLRKVQSDFHDVNNRTVYNVQMSDAIVEAVVSLARRLSKLERAEKATPERKQVQEEFPRRKPRNDNFSVDVLLDIRAFGQVTGYYCYQSDPPMWKVYWQNGEEILREPVKSWQYITDATTPPIVAPSTWVSVEERLPEVGKLYRNLSDNVLVFVKGYKNAERIYIGFYNHHKRVWDVVGRERAPAIVIKWMPLPEPPNE